LKNKFFFGEISLSYIFIPENDDFLKGNCPNLPELLKNKKFINGKFARILEK
jgi:hypothetical protein